jgi:hypothetical protein
MKSVVVLGGGVVGEDDLCATMRGKFDIRNKGRSG